RLLRRAPACGSPSARTAAPGRSTPRAARRKSPSVALVDPDSYAITMEATESRTPRSNRACRFPAHGLPVIGRYAALGSLHPEGLLRVADRAAQAIETQALEVFARPTARFTGLQVSTLALTAQSL